MLHSKRGWHAAFFGVWHNLLGWLCKAAEILDPGPGEPKQCPDLLNEVPSNHCIAYDVTNLGAPSSMLQHGDEVKTGVLRMSLVSPLANFDNLWYSVPLTLASLGLEAYPEILCPQMRSGPGNTLHRAIDKEGADSFLIDPG